MSKKFTPGPWRLSPWYDGKPGLNTKPGRWSGIYQPVPGQKYGSLSTVVGVGLKGPVDDYWLQISDPDACLIAAAPDLLVAGKHLAVKLAEVYRAAGADPATCQAIRDWMAAADKAEGRL